MPKNRVDDLPSLPRMAPVEHRRNLYKEAEHVLPEDRKIKRKEDLVEALKDFTAQQKGSSTSSPTRQESKQSATTGSLASMARATATPEFTLNCNIVKRRGIEVQNGKPLDGIAAVGAGDGPGLLPHERKPIDSTTKTIKDLEQTILEYSKRFNKLQESRRTREKLALELETELQGLIASNKKLQPNSTPEMRQVSRLEEMIQEKRQQLAETEFRYSQLQHMESRLKRNQITFDGHLRMMDEALNVAEKELAEVQQYQRSLETTKENAAIALAQQEQEMSTKAIERQTELNKRHQELEVAQKADAWRRQRDAVHAELNAKIIGDLSAEEEETLVADRLERERLYKELSAKLKTQEEKASKLYGQFVEIKQQTGVSTLNEMIEKLSAQQISHESLVDEKDEADRRLQAAQKAFEKAQRDLKRIEALGDISSYLQAQSNSTAHLNITSTARSSTALNSPHDTVSSKATFDEETQTVSAARTKLTKRIRSTKAKLNATKAALSRLATAFVAAKQGADALQQKLVPFSDLLPPPNLQEVNITPVSEEDDALRDYQTMIASVDLIEHKFYASMILSSVLQNVKYICQSLRASTSNDRDSGRTNVTPLNTVQVQQVTGSPIHDLGRQIEDNNVRVVPQKEQEEVQPKSSTASAFDKQFGTKSPAGKSFGGNAVLHVPSTTLSDDGKRRNIPMTNRRQVSHRESKLHTTPSNILSSMQKEEQSRNRTLRHDNEELEELRASQKMRKSIKNSGKTLLKDARRSMAAALPVVKKSEEHAESAASPHVETTINASRAQTEPDNSNILSEPSTMSTATTSTIPVAAILKKNKAARAEHSSAMSYLTSRPPLI